MKYDSFGNITSGSTSLSRFLYTGQEYDPDAGMYYYNARWYDPKIGRFVSDDPTGFAEGDLNLARYVGNHVVNSSDPSGRGEVEAYVPDGMPPTDFGKPKTYEGGYAPGTDGWVAGVGSWPNFLLPGGGGYGKEKRRGEALDAKMRLRLKRSEHGFCRSLTSGSIGTMVGGGSQEDAFFDAKQNIGDLLDEVGKEVVTEVAIDKTWAGFSGGGFIGGGGSGRRPRKPVGGTPTTGSGLGHNSGGHDCPTIKKLSQPAKKRLAKERGGIPRSSQPTSQGRYGSGTKWWEYIDSNGKRKIVVEHPDGTIHVGTPKPQSPHIDGSGPPKYYPVPGTGHVGE